MLRVRQQTEVKSKLSNTLRNWLPILHSSLGDLGDAMAPFVEGNPLIEVKSGFEEDFEQRIPKNVITSYSIHYTKLYERAHGRGLRPGE